MFANVKLYCDSRSFAVFSVSVVAIEDEEATDRVEVEWWEREAILFRGLSDAFGDAAGPSEGVVPISAASSISSCLRRSVRLGISTISG